MYAVAVRLLTLLALSLIFLWLIGMKIVSRLADLVHFAAPCPVSFSWALNHPFRRWYLRHVPAHIDFRQGERVLEIGPGIGVFTEKAARQVGPRGVVIAVDIQIEMAFRLAQRMKEAGVTNVRICVSNAETLPLASNTIDRAFAVSVMAEIPHKPRAFDELYRVLQSNGILSITEEFIDPDYPFPWETARRARAAGFAPIQQHGGLWTYTSNFMKPTQGYPDASHG